MYKVGWLRHTVSPPFSTFISSLSYYSLDLCIYRCKILKYSQEVVCLCLRMVIDKIIIKLVCLFPGQLRFIIGRSWCRWILRDFFFFFFFSPLFNIERQWIYTFLGVGHLICFLESVGSKRKDNFERLIKLNRLRCN